MVRVQFQKKYRFCSGFRSTAWSKRVQQHCLSWEDINWHVYFKDKTLLPLTSIDRYKFTHRSRFFFQLLIFLKNNSSVTRGSLSAAPIQKTQVKCDYCPIKLCAFSIRLLVYQRNTHSELSSHCLVKRSQIFVTEMGAWVGCKGAAQKINPQINRKKNTQTLHTKLFTNSLLASSQKHK